MQVPVQVAAPLVHYDVDILWPNNGANRIAVGQAWETTGLRGGKFAVPLIPAPGGGGVTTMDIDARGQVYGHLDSNGGGAKAHSNLEYFRAYFPRLATGLAPVYQNPSWYKLYRVQFGLRTAAATAAVWSYFGWAPEGQLGAGSPESNNCFFGLRGDGAGGWQYCARNVAGVPVQEAVALGIAQTAYVVWDMVLLSATATAPAQFELYANGLPLLTRTWGPGTVLPIPTDFGVTGTHYDLLMGADDAAVACAMQLSAVRCMAGRFQVNGMGV